MDSLIYHETKFQYTAAQRERIVSKQARPEELGGALDQIGPPFFNEVCCMLALLSSHSLV